MFDVYEERSSIKEPIIKKYDFGSIVYGTQTFVSDYDCIVVVKSNEDLLYQVKSDSLDATVYSEDVFIKAIRNHKINVLECIFQYGEDPYLEYFKLNRSLLRKEISSVSSNSWVKCKKKLQQGNIYVGLKSLFHSLRILMFGLQISKYGKIINYQEANYLLDRILEIGDNWDSLNEEFKPIYNSLKTRFRALTPMEEN